MKITYNGENRPIRFENAETQTIIDCGYDSQGRRYFKKVTVAGTTTLHHRYIRTEYSYAPFGAAAGFLASRQIESL